MSSFEGISFGTDKNAVVFDIGNAYTKCGFVGEAGPRCIIPSMVKDPSSGQIIKLSEYRDKTHLFKLLQNFLHYLYFKHLLVNPKERRVIICESLLCPTVLRQSLADVFFYHFEVPSILFGPHHFFALMTLNINVGLVMDTGYSETLVVPIYEGIPVMRACQSLPLGGKAIHRRLEKDMLDSCTVTTKETKKALSDVLDELDEKSLEDIKARSCFLTTHERAKLIHSVECGHENVKVPAPPANFDYPIDGGNVIHIEGKIREHTCEVLFEQDNEESSLATLLLDSLLQVPRDMRYELAANIVIIGGTAMTPGFYPRLHSELLHLTQTPKYNSCLFIKTFKFHQPPAKENYTAWLGASMIGSAELLSLRSVTRENYLNKGTLPDWCVMDKEAKQL